MNKQSLPLLSSNNCATMPNDTSQYLYRYLQLSSFTVLLYQNIDINNNDNNMSKSSS